jgi:hypothetical protein
MEGSKVSGKRIVEGAEEALAVARGEVPAERLHVNGHAYVPASRIEALEAEVARLREEVETQTAFASPVVQNATKETVRFWDYNVRAIRNKALEDIAFICELPENKDATAPQVAVMLRNEVALNQPPPAPSPEPGAQEA